MMKRLIKTIALAVITLVSFQCSHRSDIGVYITADGEQKEWLGRGLVALVRADTSVYLGWRLLEDDPEDVAFNLYRKMIGAVLSNDYVKVNAEPITNSTNYVDKGSDYHWLEGTTVKVHEAHMYKLTRIVNGKEEDVRGGETYVFLSLGDKNYRSILLNDIHSSVGKIGIGDLDGDGEYDFVVLLNPLQYVDPGTCETCWNRSRDTYKLEAYNSKGKFLWRYDLGWSIETGLWLAPFVVYDLDGDGKAEVYIKGGEGDPRELDGRVLRGPEYLIKLDGETGKVLAKRPWIPRIVDPERSYCHTSRNFLSIAYLDGKKPSLLMQRGNYGIIKIEAMDKNLKTEWFFENTDENAPHWAGGGHTTLIADIDEDGKDEIIPGTFAIDHDGTFMWSLGLGHSDGAVVADIDPERPGLEIFFNIEPSVPRNGVCMVDALTGEYIMEYDYPTNHVHGGATVGDWDPKHPGMECYAGPDRGDNRPFLYSAKGERLSDSFFLNATPLYWDDDEYKELLDYKGNVYKYGGDTLQRNIPNGYIVDLFGDWREEVIVCMKGEIRIYSSTLPANNKRVCLMQDRQYRMGVAVFSMGYPNEPQLSLQKNSKRR